MNLNAEEILGDRCHPDLGDLPTKPDVVVPPKVTEEIVKTCKSLGIKRVWMQPAQNLKVQLDFATRIELTSSMEFAFNHDAKREHEGFILGLF